MLFIYLLIFDFGLMITNIKIEFNDGDFDDTEIIISDEDDDEQG